MACLETQLTEVEEVVDIQLESGSGWVRDLLRDGDVEANPGPQPLPLHPPPGPVRKPRDKPRASPLGEGHHSPFSQHLCPECSWVGETVHALSAHMLDTHVPAGVSLESWLAATTTARCTVCGSVEKVGSGCPRCLIAVQGPVGNMAAAIELATWKGVVLLSRGILRSVPEVVRNEWFSGLTKEFEFFLRTPSLGNYLRVQSFVRIVLAPVDRGGRAHSGHVVRSIRSRLSSWERGGMMELARSHLLNCQKVISRRGGPSRSSGVDASLIPDAPRRAILRAVGDGELGKAAKLLDAVWGDVSASTVASKLPELYPFREAVSPDLVSGPLGSDFSADEVRRVLLQFPRGSSGGLGGLMCDHLVGEGPIHSRLVEVIAGCSSAFAWNRLPSEVSALIAGAKLVTLPKKDGGMRPIAVGELIRRIAGKLLVNRYQAEAASVLRPAQLGVAVPRGVECIIHEVNQWVSSCPVGEVLAQVDLRNAFGCVDRAAFLEAIASASPYLVPYCLACYGHPVVVANSSHQASVHQGLHQGDPLSPLLFSIAIQPVVTKVRELQAVGKCRGVKN